MRKKAEDFMEHKELIALAEGARKNSYAPYSKFAVGAALLAKSGKVYLGCNVENASFGGTNCAERTAIFSAVAAGEKEFEAMAVIGAPVGEPGRFCAPCGICRQVMSEFFDMDTPVILGSVDVPKAYPLSELLPFAFTPKDL